MQVKPRQRIAAPDDVDRVRQGGHQVRQRRKHLEDDARAPGGDSAGVADKLDGVAQPLLAVQQDRLAFDRHAPEPGGLGEAPRLAATMVETPAPLEAMPTGFVFADQETAQGAVPVGVHIAWVEGDRLVIGL